MSIDCEESNLDPGIAQPVSSITVDNTLQSLEGQMQDIELNSSDLVGNMYLAFFKSFFDITQSEYKDRCKAALFPYTCLDIKCLRWLKGIIGVFNSKFENNISEELPMVTEGSAVTPPENRDTNTGIIDLEATSETKQGAEDVTNTDTGFQDINEFSYLDSFSSNIDKASHIYNILVSIRDAPDLYGPFWINLMTAGSLFYVNSFHIVFHSAYPVSFVSLGTLVELTILCLSCTTLMALSMFLCKYHFMGTGGLESLIRFIGICGYTQIPLAALCKISVWMSLAMVCFPSLKHMLYTLHLMAYFYLFISTSCTIFVTLPPLDISQRDKTFRITSIALSSMIQLIFLAILQSYTH